MKRMPDETMRRFRIGNIRGLMMWRCGRVLPDDDAGRHYLTELLIAISLGSEPMDWDVSRYQRSRALDE